MEDFLLNVAAKWERHQNLDNMEFLQWEVAAAAAITPASNREANAIIITALCKKNFQSAYRNENSNA